jgi:hypothetical protein
VPLAFTGLWLLLAWLVPVLLTALPDIAGVVISVLILGGAFAWFFFSLSWACTGSASTRSLVPPTRSRNVRAIHDWPIAEGTWAWLIRIATSVVAIACARLLLNPLGL